MFENYDKFRLKKDALEFMDVGIYSNPEISFERLNEISEYYGTKNIYVAPFTNDYGYITILIQIYNITKNME